MDYRRSQKLTVDPKDADGGEVFGTGLRVLARRLSRDSLEFRRAFSVTQPRPGDDIVGADSRYARRKI